MNKLLIVVVFWNVYYVVIVVVFFFVNFRYLIGFQFFWCILMVFRYLFVMFYYFYVLVVFCFLVFYCREKKFIIFSLVDLIKFVFRYVDFVIMQDYEKYKYFRKKNVSLYFQCCIVVSGFENVMNELQISFQNSKVLKLDFESFFFMLE